MTTTTSSTPTTTADHRFAEAYPYLEHRNIREVTTDVFENIDPTKQTSPRIHVITGPSAAGKTTAIERICRTYAHVCDKENLPSKVLRINVPAQQSPSALIRQCLLALGVQPGSSRDTILDQKRMLCMTIRRKHVGLLVGDESQHLRKTRARNGVNESIDMLKELHDETGIPFILAGIATLDEYVRADDQLMSRIGSMKRLLPYNAASPADEATFRAICHSVLNLYAKHHGLTVDLPADSWKLFALITAGRFGRLMNWLVNLEPVIKRGKTKVLNLDLLKRYPNASNSDHLVLESFWSRPEEINISSIEFAFARALANAGYEKNTVDGILNALRSRETV